MGQVEINGLLWDTENLEIDGKKYFTWQEAMDAAKSVGKRLPTKEDFEKLIATGWEWYEGNKGIWFAERKLLFPACGYRILDGSIFKQHSCVRVWSSSTLIPDKSYRFIGESTEAYVSNYSRHVGYAVRCVQDIPQTDSCKVDTSGSISNGNIQCNISVESIAKMQKTIDIYKNWLQWILLTILNPEKKQEMILEQVEDVDNYLIEWISRSLSDLFSRLKRKFLVVKGKVMVAHPGITCINYEEHPKDEMLPMNEAIAFFPEENIPSDAIIIEGDVFFIKDPLVDGYTLLCTKEIMTFGR